MKKRNSLYPEVLYSFALDLKELGQIIAAEDGSLTIPLRSAIDSNVGYVVRVGTGQPPNITICVMDLDVQNTFLVYDNGRIRMWGMWAEELMEALPSLISSAAQQVAEKRSAEWNEIGLHTAAKEMGDIFRRLDPDIKASRDCDGMPIYLLEF